jgi:pyruvate, orthophosphate dikinase
MPEAFAQLREITTSLEKHYKDMQDFEFTIQEGKLYMLQTRNGKRTGPAAVRIAVDMVEEGMITKKEAVMRVAPQQLDQLLHPVFDPKTAEDLVKLTTGISASPGAAVGRVAFQRKTLSRWRRAVRCFWCARKPRPTTFTAWTWRAAS